jgi:hypothetical protein
MLRYLHHTIRPMNNIAGIAPGWLIGYLVHEDDAGCEYRLLPVISLAGDPGGGPAIDPIVMLPDGQTARASSVAETAFSVGPTDDAQKIAAAHAATRGRSLRSAA